MYKYINIHIHVFFWYMMIYGCITSFQYNINTYIFYILLAQVQLKQPVLLLENIFLGLGSRPRPNIPAGSFIGFLSAFKEYQFDWILQREDM